MPWPWLLGSWPFFVSGPSRAGLAPAMLLGAAIVVIGIFAMVAIIALSAAFAAAG